uniref:Uncharacterized protein n=1 Tax=Anguilla anguilla TaxID=7936 RepID=A0A0E9Q8X2_ANGAN
MEYSVKAERVFRCGRGPTVITDGMFGKCYL